VEAAAKIEGPVFIRTARLPSPVYDPHPFETGKGVVLKEGRDGVLFTCGIMKEHAIEAVDLLAGEGIDLSLVTFHTIKPFDESLAREFAAKNKHVFTLEEHSIIGGLGDTVASAVIGHGVETFHKIGINDVFGQSGKPADLLKEYGLTGPQIAENIKSHLKRP
jgi:transketolase